MTIEGSLTVRLDWDGERVRRVAIASTRPLAVPRVLVGRSIDAAASMVPRLFSVCAHAQGSAAAGAIAMAAGIDAGDSLPRWRERAVAYETIGEYLRRLLIDMPVADGLEPAVAPVAQARKLIAPIQVALEGLTSRLEASADDEPAQMAREDFDAIVALASMHVFEMAPRQWSEQREVEALRSWAAGRATLPARMLHGWLADDATLGRSAIAPMPAATRASIGAAILPRLDDADFIRTPTWHAAPVETGAWSRMIDHPLVTACTNAFGNSNVTRLVARMTEFAQRLLALDDATQSWATSARAPLVDAWSSGEGVGVAAVQTARGLLVHRAQVRDGKVNGYAIVAPTEWNFHPQGSLALAAGRLCASDETRLERRTQLIVQALDPCVACRVEVAHA